VTGGVALALDLRTAAAVAIFVATYAVVAAGRLPGFRIDRAGAALLGAALMVACGALPLEDAYRAVDLDTLVLLLGMMIVVANLRLSGFFRLVNAWAVTRARHPALLLAAIVLTTGLLSAFLVNDAICLVMTPLVIELTRALRRDPVPYLLAVAMAANVGSTATITGNPQNMIIGSLAHVPYAAFTAALAPVAAAGLVLTVALVAALNPREILTAGRLEDAPPRVRVRVHRGLAAKSVTVTLVMIVLFFRGWPVAEVAIVGGACLLLTRSVKAEKIYGHVDWPLLVMFAGLFVVVAGLERAVLTPELLERARALHLDDARVLTPATALLANLVSNVPAVLVLEPFVRGLADPQRAWLVVAMASTLAGNLTLLGSVANLIVAQGAAAQGVRIGFWSHLRVGAPLTLATLALGAWWL
jgi:Na+/H+ antiporter NhaD/arsenite permease-like protein